MTLIKQMCKIKAHCKKKESKTQIEKQKTMNLYYILHIPFMNKEHGQQELFSHMIYIWSWPKT